MSNAQVDEVVARQEGLNRGMKSRHLFMITLGGVIGTGLFLASGSTISQAGPLGALLAYSVGGVMMYLVMLCLGELAVAMPVAGSFQTYATTFISPSVGFMLGWLYWLNGAITVGTDLTAAAIILVQYTSVPEWAWVLGFGGILFGLNALKVSAFGESEFWFASIKVVAIIACIITGFLLIFGLVGPSGATGVSHYVAEGLFPMGLLPVLSAMVVVSFAFNGTEIIGVAAGESEHPEKTIPRAVNATAFRTFLFYILAIFVVGAVIPWREAGVSQSIFADVFQLAGIPAAAALMSFVVVTSALSCGNSWSYSATRILWAMAREGMAPKALGRLNRNKVPMNALILTMGVSLLSLLTYKYAAATVYLWMVSLCGLAGTAGWMGICASQFFFRRQLVAGGGNAAQLRYRTPLFPLVPILGFLLNILVLAGIVADPTQRIAIWVAIPFVVIVMAYYLIFVAPRRAASGRSPER